MDTDTLWEHTDRQRERVADLLDGLDTDAWETSSLCTGWRVRDVAAHLTLAQLGAWPATVALVRARGSFDRMVHDTAVRAARRPPTTYAGAIRGMVGSRRRAPGVSAVEPLTDAMVHTLDVAVPLGVEVRLPTDAAAVSAGRCYDLSWPFHVRRRLAGVRLRATDADFERGEGREVVGPVQDLLLLVTGRTEAALPGLRGDGVTLLSR